MSARGLDDDLPGKAFYVCIANVMAKPANLPKCIIVVCASSAPKCILHAIDDELHRWLIIAPFRCKETYMVPAGPTINAVGYKLFWHLRRAGQSPHCFERIRRRFEDQLAWRPYPTRRIICMLWHFYWYTNTAQEHVGWKLWFDYGRETPIQTRKNGLTSKLFRPISRRTFCRRVQKAGDRLNARFWRHRTTPKEWASQILFIQ